MFDTTADWSVLDLAGVQERALLAARSIAGGRTLPLHLTVGDLQQDALVHVATHPGKVRGYVNAGELDHLFVWIRHRLENDLAALRTKRRAPAGGTVALDAMREEQVTAAPRPRQTGDTYSLELVEHLLAAVVDGSAAYGMTAPRSPDPGMPRAQSDPALSCTLFAHLADIRIAWRRAVMSLDERKSVLLRCAIGWSSQEIADELGCSKRTVDRYVQRALVRLRDHLNGPVQVSPDACTSRAA